MPDYIHRRFFDANNIRMPVCNSGQITSDTVLFGGTRRIGLEWPKGEGTSLVFHAGPWLGAKLDTQKVFALADYFGTNFLPGPYDTPTADSSLYRVYKITTEDLINPGQDYLEWPVELGAPVDSEGNPLLIGDQTLWTIFSSRDTVQQENPWFGYLDPMGIEVSLLVYGFNEDPVKDVVFLHYQITNHNSFALDSLFISFFVDIAVGGEADDQGGYDSTLQMIYGYNRDEDDYWFSSPIPAVGLMMLNQPIFSSYIYVKNIYYYHGPFNTVQTWYMMNGLMMNGETYARFTPPYDVLNTKYMLGGDPETQTGWVDTVWSSDRAAYITILIPQLEPEGSLEVDYAFLVSRGSNRLNSVTMLKELAAITREFYYNILSTVESDRQYQPNEYSLLQNYPNPFNASTSIDYTLP